MAALLATGTWTALIAEVMSWGANWSGRLPERRDVNRTVNHIPLYGNRNKWMMVVFNSVRLFILCLANPNAGGAVQRCRLLRSAVRTVIHPTSGLTFFRTRPN